MKPPLRRQRGGAGDAVSSAARALLGARVGQQVAGRRGGGGGRRSTAPMSRCAMPSPSPSIARTSPSASASGSSASSGRGSPASTSGEPATQPRSSGATNPGRPRSPAGASTWSPRRPEAGLEAPHDRVGEARLCAGGTRSPPRRSRPRSGAGGQPARLDVEARPSITLCIRTRPAVTSSPRPTTTAASTRRAAAPAPPPARRSPRRARPERAGRLADRQRGDRERSSPRSTRPSSSVTRRPGADHPHRLAGGVRDVGVLGPAADPDRVEPRLVEPPPRARRPPSAASTQPGSVVPTQKVAACACRRVRARAPPAARHVSPPAKANHDVERRTGEPDLLPSQRRQRVGRARQVGVELEQRARARTAAS